MVSDKEIFGNNLMIARTHFKSFSDQWFCEKIYVNVRFIEFPSLTGIPDAA